MSRIKRLYTTPRLEDGLQFLALRIKGKPSQVEVDAYRGGARIFVGRLYTSIESLDSETLFAEGLRLMGECRATYIKAVEDARDDLAEAEQDLKKLAWCAGGNLASKAE